MAKKTERRKTPRKPVYLPIKITSAGDVVANGHVLDISCFGVKLGIKLQITFKTEEDQKRMHKILSSPEVTLEIGDVGGELYMMTQVEVKWSECSYIWGDEKIYATGLNLKLNEKQKEEWKHFYDRL